jgi:hypothetical protein
MIDLGSEAITFLFDLSLSVKLAKTLPGALSVGKTQPPGTEPFGTTWYLFTYLPITS